MDMVKIFNLVDLNFLISLGVIIIFLSTFYCGAAKKQLAAMKKMEDSIKLQSDAIKLQASANQHLNLMVQELRRANRLLAELSSDMGPEEYIEPNAPVAAASVPVENDESADSQHKLYVGNIEYTATESELGSYFSQYGDVEFVNIPVNRYTGKARGFGFVTFVLKEDAERAMALHGTEFKGRQIQVNFAKERDVA